MISLDEEFAVALAEYWKFKRFLKQEHPEAYKHWESYNQLVFEENIKEILTQIKRRRE